MKLLVTALLMVLTLPTMAQFGRKSTVSKGSAYVYWGYNRSWYTDSDINFQGSGYNFTMEGVSASDNPAAFSFEDYFAIDKITIPQFNFRAGYYYKDNWSISIGYDHMKYVMDGDNRVNLYGDIEEGIDQSTNLSGSYNGEEFITDRSTFHYENSNGMNYIRVGLDYSERLIRATNRRKFGVTGMIGPSVGLICSVNDFNFAGQFDRYTASVSGIGLSIHAGIRAEFFDHLFLQTNLSGGYISNFHVRTRQRDRNAYASQNINYAEYNIVLGWLFRIKGKKDCDCPTW